MNMYWPQLCVVRLDCKFIAKNRRYSILQRPQTLRIGRSNIAERFTMKRTFPRDRTRYSEVRQRANNFHV